jgi:hypothetical protein
MENKPFASRPIPRSQQDFINKEYEAARKRNRLLQERNTELMRKFSERLNQIGKDSNRS